MHRLCVNHGSGISNISIFGICIGNSVICSDIWRKYQEWYFKIVIPNFTSRYASEILHNFEISRVHGICNKYHVRIMLLFVYTTTRKRFVIFTCRYFKLSWNTTALSQSDCRNFSCSSITAGIFVHYQFCFQTKTVQKP